MKKIFLLFFALPALAAHGSLKLPSLIGDNMVLQRETEIKLWGESKPSEIVSATCSWDNRTYSAVSDRQGRWIIKVATPKAGGPYTINFSTSHGDTKLVKDVYSGEVWLCSGQ